MKRKDGLSFVHVISVSALVRCEKKWGRLNKFQVYRKLVDSLTSVGYSKKEVRETIRAGYNLSLKEFTDEM